MVHASYLLIQSSRYKDEISYECIGLDKKFERKFVNIFLPISFNICFGCSNIYLFIINIEYMEIIYNLENKTVFY